MDYINTWARKKRSSIAQRKAQEVRKHPRKEYVPSPDIIQAQDALKRTENVVNSVPAEQVAAAALQCKSYARALLSFEQSLLQKRAEKASNLELQDTFEHLHVIYSHLDEPDGMEGVSAYVISPDLEHQIREHESTGKWTAAQSCWEVRLQKEPDEIKHHLGLSRCLRNLGHYGRILLVGAIGDV